MNDRQHYLGSSDIAGILGVSPWDTPLTVYYKKVGWPDGMEPAADPAKEKILRRGVLMEPVVRQMAQDEYGLNIIKVSTTEAPNRYIIGWSAAEIDFEITVNKALHEAWPATKDIGLGTIVNCEIKTTSPFAAKKFGEEIGDVPMEYATQALWGQYVTGRKHTLFFVLVGSDTLLTYRVDRDDELIEHIVTEASTFWRRHIMARVPPDPQTLNDLQYLFPRNQSTRIEADDALSSLWDEFEKCKREERIAAERIEELKFEIGSRMLGAEKMENPTKLGRHELVVDGKAVLAVNYCETRRMDQKRVLEAYPQAATMQTISRSYRFDPVRSKK